MGICIVKMQIIRTNLILNCKRQAIFVVLTYFCEFLCGVYEITVSLGELHVEYM